MRVRQDTAPHLFAVESETDSEQWYQVFANGRSEEHTSELQSPCNLVCRLILAEEHTSELQSPCNLVCRLLLEKKKDFQRYVLLGSAMTVEVITYNMRSALLDPGSMRRLRSSLH